MRLHLKEYLDTGNAEGIRGLRIMLEYFYASEIFEVHRKKKIPVVSVFGSARIHPKSSAYKTAHTVGKMLYEENYSVVTGASRGVMQAANQGVADAIAEQLVKKKRAKNLSEARSLPQYKKELKMRSLGLMISLPFEETKNPWVGAFATFHYFMVRKFFFAALSRAFIACEGGWGTRDEFFEMLTLVQTGKAPMMPIIYLSPDPEHLQHDLNHSVEAGYISREDLCLLDIVKTPSAAINKIKHFYHHVAYVEHLKKNNIRIFFHKPISPSMKLKMKQAWKKYSGDYTSYVWNKKSLDLIEFRGASFGSVRQIVDILNKK
jgi:uncharacterized protein (TIGR00730 family)